MNFRDDGYQPSQLEKLRMESRIAQQRKIEESIRPHIRRIDQLMAEAAAQGEYGVALYDLESWEQGINIKAIREYYGPRGFRIMAQSENGKQFFISWANT